MENLTSLLVGCKRFTNKCMVIWFKRLSKSSTDKKCRHVEYEVGDFVWAVLTKNRFSVSDYNKLSTKKIGTVEIVEKIHPNAY